MQQRIQEYLRAVAPIGRAHEQVGPFLATYNLQTDNLFLNYAIPDNDADPSADEVADLVTAYLQRRRRPRLEYLPRVAPAVEGRLVSAGFRVEGRLPLMITDAQSLSPSFQPDGISLVVPESDDDFFGMALVQAEAYGDPQTPTRDEIPRRRQALACGALAVIARDSDTGAVVGAGSCSTIRDGLTEVAAIGVVRAHRRRGIGASLARRLAADALGAGATYPWLMAAHESEQRIYERVGFGVIGEIIHVSR